MFLMRVLKSCMKHCLYLFLGMVVRLYYGGRGRDLEFGLYRWTTSEIFLVLEDGWSHECMDGGVVRNDEDGGRGY